MPYQNDMPTPAEVLELISKMPDELARCYYAPCRGQQKSDQFDCRTCGKTWDTGDQPDHPERCETGDLWCEYLGIWIRLSDMSYSGDYARGRIYVNWWYRWRMRRALARNWEYVR